MCFLCVKHGGVPCAGGCGRVMCKTAKTVYISRTRPAKVFIKERVAVCSECDLDRKIRHGIYEDYKENGGWF